jgi:hypothetical protein
MYGRINILPFFAPQAPWLPLMRELAKIGSLESIFD